MAEATQTPQFHWADYFVLVAYLCIIMFIGIFIGWKNRKQATTKEFLKGGAELHYIPVALSLQASFTSAIFILTAPVEVYNFGLVYSYLGLSYYTAIPIAAYCMLPVFYKLNLTSAYEYLENRFNRAVRHLASATFAVMTLLYLSVVLYTPAIALAQVAPISIEVSIVVCGLVCTIYTALGGMKATVWNDFFQMLVVFVSFILVIICSHVEIGGLQYVWEVGVNGSRVNFNSFDPDPTIRLSFWTQLIGGTGLHLCLYGSSQTVAQKYLSVSSLKNAKKAMWVAVFTNTFVMVSACWIGMLVYARYHDCDPISVGVIEKNDQLVPFFLMDVLGHLHGIPGLFIAAAFSAALSSVSGNLNALSAVTLVDFICPMYKNKYGEDISQKSATLISRIIATVFGLVTILLGFTAQFMGEFIMQVAISILSMVGGPLTGLLCIGMWIAYTNTWGAIAALLTSLVVCLWIGIGAILASIPSTTLPMSTSECPTDNSTLTDALTTTLWDIPPTLSGPENEPLWIYHLSFMYYSIVALIVCFIVGPLVSLCTGVMRDLPSKYVFSWADECCCCCPAPCRQCCRCGVYDDEDDANIGVVKIGSPLKNDLWCSIPGNVNDYQDTTDSFNSYL